MVAVKNSDSAFALIDNILLGIEDNLGIDDNFIQFRDLIYGTSVIFRECFELKQWLQHSGNAVKNYFADRETATVEDEVCISHHTE